MAARVRFGGLGRGRGGRGGRGAKRTSDELDKLADQFHAFVTKHPGLRIEQINKQLGTTTKDFALPIRKLIGYRGPAAHRHARDRAAPPDRRGLRAMGGRRDAPDVRRPRER